MSLSIPLPALARFPIPLRRMLPFLRWWPMVDRRSVRADLLAGLTGAIVVLPQGVAFATIAGMPPQYGLYAGMVPAVIAALFGSSWHLVSGPTTAASILLFSVLSTFAEPGSAQYVQFALTLTLMVGLIELGLGMARLGVLVNFISHSVVIGFTAGAAILIVTSQVKHFFGIAMPQGSTFAATWGRLFTHPADIQPYVLAVGAATLVLGLAARRFTPRLPYMIVAMVGGGLTAAALRFVGGADAEDIRLVGALPGAIPPLSLPSFHPEVIQQLATPALAVALLALTEAVSIARAVAVRSGQQIDGNQELIGQGLSNVVGSFFSAYVATGSFNRTGVNFAAGARTPLASIMSAGLLVVVVMLLAPLAAYLPNAAMAGVLFLVAWGLIDFHHIRQILRSGYAETVTLTVTFLATLLLSLEVAILLGALLSIGFYLSRTARPRVVARVPDPTHATRKFVDASSGRECPQLRFVRIDGSLFFGAVHHVREELAEQDEHAQTQTHLAIIAQGINFADLSGAEFLAQEARRRREMGGGLYLIRPKPALIEALEAGGYLEEIGRENIFNAKNEAIRAVYARLDRDKCARCPARIFRECNQASFPARAEPESVRLVAHSS
jgi:SulP family sulfate permease